MSRRISRAAYVAAAAFLGAILAAGCSGPPAIGEADPSGDASIHLQLSVAGTGIVALTVEVTATDIPLPIVSNIEVVAGIAEGVLSVPAGSDRLIVIRGFNADAIETHRGEATIDVVAGTNPAIEIVLEPLFGEVPVVVTLGGFTLQVEPADVTLRAGDSVLLALTIRDGTGSEVTRPVTWGAANPAVASVDGSGRVTAHHEGETQVVASYGSFRDTVTVSVTPFRWATIVAGEYHACGLDDAGRAYCWGSNVVGQIGDGTLTNRSRPTAVAGGHVFASITAGGLQTCAVTTGGAAWCWGRGYTTGQGSYMDSSVPLLVMGGLAWRSVDMGIFHACGVTVTGEGYCWGFGGNGRLGNGAAADQYRPVLVSGGHTFVGISAGRDFSCGARTDGAAYCWGWGGEYQLGTGSAGSSSTPVAVMGGHLFARVSAGGAHTCGVRRDGAGLCWGLGSQGQLGQNDRFTYVGPVIVTGGYTFASIDAGAHHTCGTTAAGQGLCWGYGSAGQIGTGGYPIAQLVPVEPVGAIDFASVYAGGAPYVFGYSESGGFSCGLTAHGGAFCWGDNLFGELGDGTTIQRPYPVPVRDP